MKFLLSPIGLILIVAVLVILFFPRRTPDAVKKRMGRPMRAFPEDERPSATGADARDVSEAGSASPESEPTAASEGPKDA